MSADVKATAVAVRKGLREQFPGVKFSVRMGRGTGYGWLHVSWTDGPQMGWVEDYVSQFESSRFDGMDDAYHRTGNTGWTCCGITCFRSISPELIDAAVSRVFIDPEDGEAKLFTQEGEVFEDELCSGSTPREVVELYYRHRDL